MKTESAIKAELQAILERVDATEAEVDYGYSNQHATRFGENAITQNMGGENEHLYLTVAFGRKHGSASTTDLSAEGKERLIKSAVENAQLSPEDPEYVKLPAPQTYPQTAKSYFEDTVCLTPEKIAGDVAIATNAAKSEGFLSSGLFCKSHGCSAIANSKGLFSYDQGSGVSYSLTVHGPAGSGSESVTNESYSRINPNSLVERAINTAKAAQNPQDIEPGDYTVIFEPRAVRDLLSYMFWSLDARSADEGTSAFAGKLGQQIVSPKISIESKIDNSELPASRRGVAGLAARPMTWIKDGVLKRLRYDRFWAQEKETDPDPNIHPVFIAGEDRSQEDLIASCKNGVLVKRLWYIRMVDAKELLLTGMTRDGFFKINNGEITAPLKNLRFNESPLVFLKNVVGMSRPERVDSGYSLPAIMSNDFTFSSKTDSL